MYTLHVTLETRILQNEAVAHVALVKSVKGRVQALLVHLELLDHRHNVVARTELQHLAVDQARSHKAGLHA